MSAAVSASRWRSLERSCWHSRLSHRGRASIRQASGSYRARHVRARRRHFRPEPASPCPACLYRSGGHRSACRCRSALAEGDVATGDLPCPVRLDRCNRTARVGSPAAAVCRCRSRCRHANGSADQVRQVAARALAPDDGASLEAVSDPAAAPLADGAGRAVPGLRQGHCARQAHGPLALRSAAQAAGLDRSRWPCRPRIHDLRHTFICRRVQLWHANGTDIDNAMVALSTYVGHAKVSDTYWYLTAAPDLLPGRRCR
jgi:hypothetical protein